MRYTLADRLKARCRQLGFHIGQVAEMAGVNRSFVYDMMRGKSTNPNLERLERVAQALKVERNWLLHGRGDVEGEAPLLENPEDAFVAIPSVAVHAVGGDGTIIDQDSPGPPYHFQRSWIKYDLRAEPANLRVLHVEGDYMMPTLHDGDIVLVDIGRRCPTPPGIFVVHDGVGLVAKRLEHIAHSDPTRMRVVADNPLYVDYECRAEDVNIVGRIRWFSRTI